MAKINADKEGSVEVGKNCYGKFTDIKNYASHPITCPITTKMLEHETSNSSFKPAYVSSVKEERQYVGKVHLRASQQFGLQNVESRVSQVPSLSKSLLMRIEELTSGFDFERAE
jgi:hypothetical protein